MQWLTVEQTLEKLNHVIKRTKLYELVRQKRIRSSRGLGKLLIDWPFLEEYLVRTADGPPQPKRTRQLHSRELW